MRLLFILILWDALEINLFSFITEFVSQLMDM